MESALNPDFADAAPIQALGQYQAWRVAGAPAAPIDLAWISVAHALTPASHRLLPHGEPSIAIMRRRDGRGAINDVKLTICGPYYRSGLYRPQPRDELIAFRLKPELCAALFGVAPKDHAGDPITDAPSDLTAACENTLRLAEHAPAKEIFFSLSADLIRFVRSQTVNTGPEARAALWMRMSEGKIRFRQIAERLEVSERNLRRRFCDHVGCAPKTYARHLQLAAAALAAEKTDLPDWAAIAAGAGFHDQPHMINVFQAEIGLTPKAFHAERRALSFAS